MNNYLQQIENNDIFKFIKENFSLIIFIPSLLGGIKQFCTLYYYSPSLIQYFSFSQIAIDGIEAIIRVIYIMIIARLVYNIIKNPKIHQWFNYLVMMPFNVLIFYVFLERTSNTDSYYYNFFFSSLISLTFSSFAIANAFAAKEIYKSLGKIPKILNIFFLVLSILAAFYAIITLKTYQNDIENVYFTTKEVKTNKSKNAKMIYYNDNYLIFLMNPEEKSSDRYFYVQKFETLFEDKEEKNK